MEALRLRIKDVDLEQRCIMVRCGKGDKDRRTVLPLSMVEPLNPGPIRSYPEGLSGDFQPSSLSSPLMS